MEILLYLIPIAISLSAIGLFAFFWTLKSSQYEDLQGTAQRILIEDDEER